MSLIIRVNPFLGWGHVSRETCPNEINGLGGFRVGVKVPRVFTPNFLPSLKLNFIASP